MSSSFDDSIQSAHPRPPLAGLRFRGFRGNGDYPLMLSVTEASKHVDQDEWTSSIDDITRSYRHLTNCDPFTDMIFAEIENQVVGYGRIWWRDERKGDRLYPLFAHLIPQWRGKGIRQAMLHHLEQRACKMAEEHPYQGTQYLQANSGEGEKDWIQLLENNAYKAVRWEYEMVRALAGDLPTHPLPNGLELRPVNESEINQIWTAAAEAFIDHWGETDWFTPQSLAEWRASPQFAPELWQVAWEGSEVAGMVLNELNEAENKEYDRKRGYTETICVRKPWRGKGLAKSLISISLHMWKDMGMQEACHGVDAENEQGALQLYTSLGYTVNKTFTTYRKPLVC